MDNTKPSGGAGDKQMEPNPNPNPDLNPPAANATNDGDDATMAAAASRRPFTALSQVDADLALARMLQEQEMAYMMLPGSYGVGGDYAHSEMGSYEEYEEEAVGDEHVGVVGGGGIEGNEYREDAFDANEAEILEEDEDEEEEEEEEEIDPAEYENDEAFAVALQEREEREVAVRLMALAGLSDWRAVEHDDLVVDPPHVVDPQDAWQGIDPDEYSYEELVALGEVVGAESRGLSADKIASLPSVTYKAENMQGGNTEQCVICRVEFEDGESLAALACKHSYHTECINQWLQINKVCPMCSAEVCTSETRQ